MVRGKEPHTIDRKNFKEPIDPVLDNYPNGIIIPIDKPYKWTSADVVRKMKFKLQRYFKSKNIKVGHAGTLDPLATGMLLVCVGKATKMADYYQAQEKEYIAEIRFGATTPCFDLEKEIDATYPYEHITIESIEKVLPSMTGEIDQIPPIFSAKMVDGSRAYDLERAGVEAKMKPSRITIYELDIISYEAPLLIIRIKCSKGTYIRSFARDLGEALQSGAHLTNLRRSSSGSFHVSAALSIEEGEKIFETF